MCFSGRIFKSQDLGYPVSGDEEFGNSNLTTRDTRHAMYPDMLNIRGYSYTSSRVHGVATFVQCATKWRDIAYSTPAEEVELVTTEVEGVNNTNV